MEDQNTNTTPGQEKREHLEAEIQRIEAEIKEFNAHFLNQKNIQNACAAVIMAFIFTGMLVKEIEMYLWASSGGLVVFYVGIMLWRNRMSAKLNSEMEAAQAAWKEYQRGRRKKMK